ncbi:metallophosphoesterase family protein [Legionella pneumophila]|uniref:metallophosphoesterase family protein n=1 Tax=Legionella pneumophila TaxID=446 RepID=UPI003B7873B6
MKNLLFLVLVILTNSLMAKENLVFAVIGDYGANSAAEAKVASVLKSKNPQFILTLGDNNYTQGCWKTIDKNVGKYYHEFIGNYQGKYGKGSDINRFFPTLGNHDWLARKTCLYQGTLPYFSYFTLPGNQSYYDFVRGPIHFFALDSDSHEPDGSKEGSKQYQWLTEQVQQSKAPFKIVYFHHAPLSSGKHGSNTRMQWNFASMGIDVVMSGHDHHYERIERNGIVYFVNGVGGAELYSYKKWVEGSKFFYSKHHGFMLITALEHAMKIQFINENDEIKDEIVIQEKKQGAGEHQNLR